MDVRLPELPNGWWPKKQGKQYFDAEQMQDYAIATVELNRLVVDRELALRVFYEYAADDSLNGVDRMHNALLAVLGGSNGS